MEISYSILSQTNTFFFSNTLGAALSYFNIGSDIQIVIRMNTLWHGNNMANMINTMPNDNPLMPLDSLTGSD